MQLPNLRAGSFVLSDMMPVTKRRIVKPELWAAYKNAFRVFSEKVRNIQREAAKPVVPPNEIEAAVLAVEKARVAYSNARNAVAKELLESPPGAVMEPPESSPAHTAEVAKLLWESGGRPDGTAESDWYRAEEIIRTAREEEALQH
jgi:hypothetical protein